MAVIHLKLPLILMPEVAQQLQASLSLYSSAFSAFSGRADRHILKERIIFTFSISDNHT